MAKPISLIASALLLVSPATWAAEGEPEALIGTSEQVSSHEAGAEDLGAREAGAEDIHGHEAGSRPLEGMSVPAERLSDHESTSETMEGREARSERLSGMGHPVESSGETLERAQRALRDAQSAHAAARREHVPAARSQEHAPSSSFGTGGHSQWMARMELQQQRVRVAKAKQEVMDARYARMLRRDTPRGEAREQLIAEREAAQARVESEMQTSHRLAEQARAAGVPPSVLEMVGH